MLLSEAQWAGVEIRTGMEVSAIKKNQDGTFSVKHLQGKPTKRVKLCWLPVGLSMPKIASDLAFRTANDFGLEVVAPRAALVPLTWNSGDKASFADLSGISLDAEVSCGAISFRENILFTHRGLSGPSILQISSFWREGGVVLINLLPELDAETWLLDERTLSPKVHLSTLLKKHLPNRLVDYLAKHWFARPKDRQLYPCRAQRYGETVECLVFQARRYRRLPHSGSHLGRYLNQ